MDELSRRLAELGSKRADQDLSSLERDVWARIDGRSLHPMPRRFATALSACVWIATSFAGVATAAHASPAPSPFAVFEIGTPGAPSTALGY